MSQPSPHLAQRPAHAPADVTAASLAQLGPVEVANAVGHKRSLVVPATIAFVLIGITGLLVAAFLIASLGTGAVAIAGFMALVPLAAVLLGIRWIDRWEREPRALLIFCFLWGSITSIFVALLVGVSVEIVQDGLGTSAGDRDFLGSVIQAPVVEEAVKGFGVLILFLAARKYFDGPVDGVVYAATIAAGFAFTENILYFGAELLGAGSVSGVIGVFVIRGVMSPFAHVMFTICTGVAIGVAARRRGIAGGFIAYLVGLVPAIVLHALWNGATIVVADDFLLYYVVVQMPLFFGALTVVILLRRAESRLTRTRLDEYAAAGWYSASEIPALATPAGRRQALTWARAQGLHLVMRGYIADSTRLAFIRQRMVNGHGLAEAQAEEAAILAAIVSRRAALLAVPPTA